jgi:hypothetical protein
MYNGVPVRFPGAIKALVAGNVNPKSINFTVPRSFVAM